MKWVAPLPFWGLFKQSPSILGNLAMLTLDRQATHLQDGEKFKIPVSDLIRFGQKLFKARFTIQEGAGRPLSKGTGAAISDPSSPLVFPRNFDRISSPESNSCVGCHNAPAVGGGGDRVTEVFVLAQRFDHLTFDHDDLLPLRGAIDESGKFVTMNNATNDRKTIGIEGSGFLEMVARQMTADLGAVAAATPFGSSRQLGSKGVGFGTITHNADGTWDTSRIAGLPVPSSTNVTLLPVRRDHARCSFHIQEPVPTLVGCGSA